MKDEKKEIQNVGLIQQESERRESNSNRTSSQHNQSIRIADLFGGVGGFRLGIESAWRNISHRKDSGQGRNKFNTPLPENKQCSPHCVFYCDSDKYAVQTYNKNFGENHKPTDIRTIKADSIPDFDLLCGGFPCQAFSVAGKRKGFGDTRGTLFFEIERILKAKRPRLVFLENVKGLLNHDEGRTFGTILNALWELGYDVQWMVLNSKFFGVPQNRERVFIIGSLRGKSRPEILPFGFSGEEISGKVIGTLETDGWEKRHEQIRRVWDIEGTAPTIPTGQGGGVMTKISIPHFTQVHNMQPRSPNRPSLIKNPKSGGHGHLQRDDTSYCLDGANTNAVEFNNMKIRRLTPTECERLQGFPDGWTEGVSDTQRYKQMGNAVTVNVIQAIATPLLSQFKGDKKQ